jgi:hypothetical protein
MRVKGWKLDGNGRSVSGNAGRLLLNWQLLRAGFPLTVIQVEERARYLGALDQGLSRHSSAGHANAPEERWRKGAKAEHAGQLLDLQTLVAARSSGVWIERPHWNPIHSMRTDRSASIEETNSNSALFLPRAVEADWMRGET